MPGGAPGIAEISTSTNQLIGFVSGVPSGFIVQAIAISPNGKYRFAAGYISSTRVSELLVLNAVSGKLISDVTAPSAPLFCVVSKNSSTVFYQGLFEQTFFQLSAFDVATGAFTLTPAPVCGGNIVLSPDGSSLYIACAYGNDGVFDYNIASQTSTFLPSPVDPEAVAVTPDGSELVVSSYNNNALGVINIANPTIGTDIPVGGETSGISISSMTRSDSMTWSYFGSLTPDSSNAAGKSALSVPQ